MRRRYCVVVWASFGWVLWQETTWWSAPREADRERAVVGTAETKAECERLADQHATRMAEQPKGPREWRARGGNTVALYEGAEHKTSWAYRCLPGGAESR